MTKNIKLVIYREEMTSSSPQKLVIYREEMTSSSQKISDL